MRDLAVVGLSDDGRHLLLAGASGRIDYRVLVDESLSAALRGEKHRPGRAASTVPSPREIQAELRAGATVEGLAEQAGVPVARIERFAGPVLSERARVLDTVLGLHQVGRQGRSLRPLGIAVDSTLAALSGVRADSVAWTAYRPADGEWTVRLTFVSRGRDRQAEWVWDHAEGCVRACDRSASGLGFVPAVARPPTARPSTARPPTAGRRSAPVRRA